jgi:hypothetical protein
MDWSYHLLEHVLFLDDLSMKRSYINDPDFVVRRWSDAANNLLTLQKVEFK